MPNGCSSVTKLGTVQHKCALAVEAVEKALESEGFGRCCLLCVCERVHAGGRHKRGLDFKNLSKVSPRDDTDVNRINTMSKQLSNMCPGATEALTSDREKKTRKKRRASPKHTGPSGDPPPIGWEAPKSNRELAPAFKTSLGSNTI